MGHPVKGEACDVARLPRRCNAREGSYGLTATGIRLRQEMCTAVIYSMSRDISILIRGIQMLSAKQHQVYARVRYFRKIEKNLQVNGVCNSNRGRQRKTNAVIIQHDRPTECNKSKGIQYFNNSCPFRTSWLTSCQVPKAQEVARQIRPYPRVSS
jgi:hypothetical protein